MIHGDTNHSTTLMSTVSNTAKPMPRSGPTYPYALTNPIWVDLDGDGFDAPGLPSWLVAPETPE